MPQLEEASNSPSEEVVVEIGSEEYRFHRPRYDSPWLNSPPSHGGRSGRPPSQRSDDAEIEHAESDGLSDESDSITSPDDTPPPEPEAEPGWAVHPFGGKRAPIIRSEDDPPVVEEPSPTASERARWREIDEPDTSRQRYFSREEQEYFNALYERGWSPVEQPPRSEHAAYAWRPNQEIVRDVPNKHRRDPNLPEALVLKVPDYQGKPEPSMKLEYMPKVVRFWLTKKDDEFENAEGREITERWKNSEKIQPAAGRPKTRVKRVKAMIQEEVSAWWREAIQAEAGGPAVGTPEVTTDRGAPPAASGPAGTTNPAVDIPEATADRGTSAKNEPVDTASPWAGRLRKRPPKPPKDEKKPPARRRKKNTGGATASGPRSRARRTKVKRSGKPQTPIPPASPPPPPPPPPPPQQPDGTTLDSTPRSPTPFVPPPPQHTSGEPPNSPRYSLSPSPASPPSQPANLDPENSPSDSSDGDHAPAIPTSPPIPTSPCYSLTPSPPPPSERAPSQRPRQIQHNMPTSPRYSPPASLSPDFDLDLDLDLGSEARGSQAAPADGAPQRGRRGERGYWVWEERREVHVRARRTGVEDEEFEMAAPRRPRTW